MRGGKSKPMIRGYPSLLLTLLISAIGLGVVFAFAQFIGAGESYKLADQPTSVLTFPNLVGLVVFTGVMLIVIAAYMTYLRSAT